MGSAGTNRLVLYLEDSPEDQFFFKEAVSRSGTPIVVRWFPSSAPVLAYLRREAPFDVTPLHPWPDLLLCDYSLGSEDGALVVEQVRGIPACAGLPIVMLSGCLEDRVVRRSYVAGVDHFLSKPPDFAELERLARTLGECLTSKTPNFEGLARLPHYRPRRHFS